MSETITIIIRGLTKSCAEMLEKELDNFDGGAGLEYEVKNEPDEKSISEQAYDELHTSEAEIIAESAPEELSPARELACDIIDTIEEQIICDHPEIGDLVKKYEGNALLHGINYYEVEDWITQRLETGKFKVKHEDELIKEVRTK